MSRRVLAEPPITSFDDYLGAGGGEGLRRALELGPADVIDVLERGGTAGAGRRRVPDGGEVAFDAAGRRAALTPCATPPRVSRARSRIGR